MPSLLSSINTVLILCLLSPVRHCKRETMTQFWRPFDPDDNEDQATGIQITGKPGQKKRCTITLEEEKIVLEDYKICTGGWSEMLQFVKGKVEEIRAGDVMKQRKLRDYYREASQKSAIKRMQRIVNKKAGKVDEIPSVPSTSTNRVHSDSMANSIMRAKVRYSQKATPEQRKPKKLDLMLEDSCSSSDEDSQITMSPETSVKDTTQESQPPVPTKVSKKRKRNRGKTARESHEAHTKMCERAMGMMDKITTLLDKFESESD